MHIQNNLDLDDQEDELIIIDRQTSDIGCFIFYLILSLNKCN